MNGGGVPEVVPEELRLVREGGGHEEELEARPARQLGLEECQEEVGELLPLMDLVLSI